ncbi:pyridoxal-dependent decarboxylase [Mesorhizobium hungaricum]|uniref:Pyridoxal-dependent decarboxylase n=2 Tax=Hyphomicrobiales TaxID=356 RepID=A0A1C2EDY8_9HYPH|nr:aminotransferase class V-fold PLP-dependent enzyme [Mesorhizobium sp.]OCX25196.1 pyridoxal-dependent decarboxylase [Mesorhizobium hungaricum]
MKSQRNSLLLSDGETTALVDAVADIAKAYWLSLPERRTYPATSGAETEALLTRSWSEEGIGPAVFESFGPIADRSRPAGDRFFGYVFGSGEPVSAVSELLVAALNQNVTSWRSSPAATTIERTVISWLADAIGCPGLSGSLCGGGSTANLMALAIAREAKCSANENGSGGGIVYCSKEVHFSIPKAMALLGLGRKNLRLIETDDALRMQPDLLHRAITDDRAAGLMPIAVIATTGTVVSGAIDPVEEIAAIAREQDLWLHVDGAYGGLAALAKPEYFAGLSLADSVSIDAHKWLYQPVDCGCLLYRDRNAARRAFSQQADYVRVLNEDPIESFVFFDESIELTRRFRALKLWMSLQYHGRAAFRAAIEQDLANAQLLARKIEEHPELELFAPVSLSAVCFGHRDKDNEALLRRLIARGRVYLSNASFGGRFTLRACFVNHRATPQSVDLIVSEVIDAANEIND